MMIPLQKHADAICMAELHHISSTAASSIPVKMMDNPTLISN